MNKKDILNKAFDEIRDEYLLEAAEERIKSRKKGDNRSVMLYRYGLAAACMIFIFIAATVQIWKYSGNQEGDTAATKAEDGRSDSQNAEEDSTAAIVENDIKYEKPSETQKESVKVPGCIIKVTETEYEIQLCGQEGLKEEDKAYMVSEKMQTDYAEGQLVLVEVVSGRGKVLYNPWYIGIFEVQRRTYMGVTRTLCIPKEVLGIEPFECDGSVYGTLITSGYYEVSENGEPIMCYRVKTWETEDFEYQFAVDDRLFDGYLTDGDDVVVTYDTKTLQAVSVVKADEETVKRMKPVSENNDYPSKGMKQNGLIVSVTEDEYEVQMLQFNSGKYYLMVPKYKTDYAVGQEVQINIHPYSDGTLYVMPENPYNSAVHNYLKVKKVLGIALAE